MTNAMLLSAATDRRRSNGPTVRQETLQHFFILYPAVARRGNFPVRLGLTLFSTSFFLPSYRVPARVIASRTPANAIVQRDRNAVVSHHASTSEFVAAT